MTDVYIYKQVFIWSTEPFLFYLLRAVNVTFADDLVLIVHAHVDVETLNRMNVKCTTSWLFVHGWLD